MKTILIAGAASGVGKTTISVGIMSALSRRGLRVQPFKVGPDYIDPSHHTLATGNASRNLDSWLLPADAMVELFARSGRGKDVGVIEGVMGLFDSRTALDDDGSTAEVAKALGVPVILILDAYGAARSLAAMAKGYNTFDPKLRISGILLNHVGSASHFELCRQAVEAHTGIPVLGYLPKNHDFSLPERHLGLVPAEERPVTRQFLDKLACQVESSIDLDRLLAIACRGNILPDGSPSLFPARRLPASTVIALARDRAFNFYYEDSLDLLRAWGAELAPFSPLEDTALPAGATGIYLGGGFPELYAEILESNKEMRSAIRSAAKDGMPVYGECGGLMYLGSSIRDLKGHDSQMAGVFPFGTRIDRPSLSLGYRTVRARVDTPILSRGQEVRGHEFHWSIMASRTRANAYELVDGAAGLEGFVRGNSAASYIHLHLGSDPRMAPRFIACCRQYAATKA